MTQTRININSMIVAFNIVSVPGSIYPIRLDNTFLRTRVNL